MYAANATVELGPVLDRAGEVVHEARTLRAGDQIADADLGLYQSAEDVRALVKQKALEKS